MAVDMHRWRGVPTFSSVPAFQKRRSAPSTGPGRDPAAHTPRQSLATGLYKRGIYVDDINVRPKPRVFVFAPAQRCLVPLGTCEYKFVINFTAQSGYQLDLGKSNSVAKALLSTARAVAILPSS